MQLASQEAQRFNHEEIKTGHILLGLIKEGTGVAAHALKNFDLNLSNLRKGFLKIEPEGEEKIIVGRIPQTSLAKKTIEKSMEFARSLSHNFVGTEHILLGLTKIEMGSAFAVLKELGVKQEDIRNDVLMLLGHEQPSSSFKMIEKKIPRLEYKVLNAQGTVEKIEKKINQLADENWLLRFVDNGRFYFVREKQ